MKLRRAAIAAIAAVATTALVAGVPAGAEDVPAEEESELLPIDVSPPSGPAGTVVTVSGAGCLTEAGPGEVEVYVFFGEEEEPQVFVVAPEEDGSWLIELESHPETPPGVFTFTATCFASSDPEAEVVADYDFAEFEVLASTEPTPPTSEPDGPPTLTPVDDEPAPPATPVPGEPTFTG